MFFEKVTGKMSKTWKVKNQKYEGRKTMRDS